MRLQTTSLSNKSQICPYSLYLGLFTEWMYDKLIWSQTQHHRFLSSHDPQSSLPPSIIRAKRIHQDFGFALPKIPFLFIISTTTLHTWVWYYYGLWSYSKKGGELGCRGEKVNEQKVRCGEEYHRINCHSMSDLNFFLF